MERLELPKLKLTLQPKVEAKVKVTPIRAITESERLEQQQPRRVFRGD